MNKSSDKSIATAGKQGILHELRRTVERMLDVIERQDATQQERQRACSTIRDAFAGRVRSNPFGVNLADYELSEAANDVSVDRHTTELDTQESEFAERLRELMKARAITQAQLASRIGCSQPAISLMLKRQCRPQRSTILKLATALNVDPRDLWRDLDVADILDTVAAAQEEQIMSETEAEALRAALQPPATSSSAEPLPKRKR